MIKFIDFPKTFKLSSLEIDSYFWNQRHYDLKFNHFSSYHSSSFLENKVYFQIEIQLKLGVEFTFFESKPLILKDNEQINIALVSALDDFHDYLISVKNLKLKEVLEYIELNIAKFCYLENFYT